MLHRLAVWLLFFFCSAHCLTLSWAKCDLLDTNRNPVSLQNLPDGVRYDDASDTLYCMEPLACEAWTIHDCRMVSCQNYEACLDGIFQSNEVVHCRATRACHRAVFYRSHDVVCGTGGEVPSVSSTRSDRQKAVARYACVDSTVESDSIVHCRGALSCTLPGGKPRDDHTGTEQVHLGWELIVYLVSDAAHVYCDLESRSTASIGPACQAMRIHVKDESRACFAEASWVAENPCAVICATFEACDSENIKFVVD